jgi:hypothetical protein
VGATIVEHNNACRVVDVKEGKATSFDLTVDPGKKLTLRLTDPDGKPVTGALAAGVNAMPTTVVSLATDECPVYALDGKKTRQLIFLHAKRKLAGLATVRGDEKKPVVVKMTATATLTGRLLNSKGEPLAGESIFPVYTDPSIGKALSYRLMRGGVGGGRVAAAPPQTDKKGEFRVEGLLPGQKLVLLIQRGAALLGDEADQQRGPLKSGTTTALGDIRIKSKP